MYVRMSSTNAYVYVRVKCPYVQYKYSSTVYLPENTLIRRGVDNVQYKYSSTVYLPENTLIRRGVDNVQYKYSSTYRS
jgi:hypothetical protein